MRTRLLAVLGIGTVLLGGAAPEVWKKDFTAWTVEDARQIVTDSPWAKETPLPMSQRSGVSYMDLDPIVSASSPPTAELGTSSVEQNAPPPSGRKPSMTSTPVGAPQTEPGLKVIWASALPVRLAVLKLRAGASGPSAEEVEHAQKEWPRYVLAVEGLPAPDAGSDPKALAQGASLSLPGKPRIPAMDSDYRRIGNADVYFFRFQRPEPPLTAAKGDAEFDLSVGRIKISQKFHLAAMQYQGKVAI